MSYRKHFIARKAEDVPHTRLPWLWPGRVPQNKVAIISGEPGLGKSLVTLDFAARVTTGRAWPDTRGTPQEPGGVVLISAEDDFDDIIKPRLIAAEFDPKRLVIFDGVGWTEDEETGEHLFSLDQDTDVLESLIEDLGNCRMVVIDPVSAFVGKTDSHKNTEVRALMHPLKNLAGRQNCAIVCVSHLNKGSGSALSRVSGSGAFTAAPRAVWQITRDPQDPRRRLFLPSKNNYGEDTKCGLAYTIGTVDVVNYGPAPHILWCDGTVTMSADDALRESTEKDEAAVWLREYLLRGPQLAKDVFDTGENGEGFSRDSIKRAKRLAGVKASKDGYQGAWQWAIYDSTPRPARLLPLDSSAPFEKTTTTAPFEEVQREQREPKGARGGTVNTPGHPKTANPSKKGRVE